MKRRVKWILSYLPWLCLLFGLDVFSALLLWLADPKAFSSMVLVIFLASVFLFLGLSGVLLFFEARREQAFLAFLENPDEYHEQLLLRSSKAASRESIRLLADTLRRQQRAYEDLKGQQHDYEEYVESWAHETKTPLSLLTLLLDNRKDELPDKVLYKLNFVRSSLQESVDQMLFYARLKGERKDYLFESVNLRLCMEEVLEDYQPLLGEKEFQVQLRLPDAFVYSDRRSLRFLLGQFISNSIKYCGEQPVLCIDYHEEETRSVLIIRDNGIGVPLSDLPYIFEKGFTGNSGKARKKATGMGLYLAEGIAKELSLSLEAESEWGKGFEMRVFFPVVQKNTGFRPY